MSGTAPENIVALAGRRSDARSAGDFETADRLRAEIEAAGWRIIDHGRDFRLEPAQPPDREVGGLTHYGSSASVPSRLDGPPTATVTVVLVAGAGPERLAASVAAHRDAARAGTQLVVVVEEPGRDVEARLTELGPAVEVVRMAAKVGLAGCWNAGARRAAGSVIVLSAPGTELRGDVAAQSAAALADTGVAVVGAAGLDSGDLRHWHPSSGPEVDAVDAEVLAFRRADWVERGPLDERFVDARLLAIWWSLVLRDAGQDAPAHRALALPLPVEPASTEADEGHERAARRDFYRILDRFGRRYDLLREPIRPTAEGRTARPL
jgi:hypothetical protein